jgi:hypothetical protein
MGWARILEEQLAPGEVGMLRYGQFPERGNNRGPAVLVIFGFFTALLYFLGSGNATRILELVQRRWADRPVDLRPAPKSEAEAKQETETEATRLRVAQEVAKTEEMRRQRLDLEADSRAKEDARLAREREVQRQEEAAREREIERKQVEQAYTEREACHLRESAYTSCVEQKTQRGTGGCAVGLLAVGALTALVGDFFTLPAAAAGCLAAGGIGVESIPDCGPSPKCD